ncbi:tetratricopeptide repeat protein [bacterium]|nr:tetratricopeptide repeat protein [bacterium]
METENIDEIISNAKTSFHKNKYPQAIKGFEYAYNHYKEIGDELNAAEMANNLSVSFLHNRKAKEALEIVEGTDKIFEEHHDITKQAMAIGNKGAALEALKRFDEAIEAYNQSIALFDEAGEKEMRSYVYKSLSALHLKKGDNFKSIYAMQQSINTQEKLSLKDRIVRFILQIPEKLFSR